MSRSARRRMAALAERRLAREQARWQTEAAMLHARVAAHRLRWLLGGGVVAGAVVDRLPWPLVVRCASMGVSAASFALRFPFGVLLAGRAAAQVPKATQDSRQ